MSATDDLPTRVALLEQTVRGTAATLERIERRLDVMDTRLEARFASVDTRIAGLQVEGATNFRFLVTLQVGIFGLTLTTFASLLGLAAHKLG